MQRTRAGSIGPESICMLAEILAPRFHENPAPVRAAGPREPAVRSLVERIRAAIAQRGSCALRPGELHLLCPEEMSQSDIFRCIAAIAQEGAWSFKYLPDGRVSFAPLAGIAC
jgi:hypothetical protein